MASLDGYSINKKIDDVRDDLKAELLKLRNEFTDLYAYMKKYNTIKAVPKKTPKPKVEKVLETTESEE